MCVTAYHTLVIHVLVGEIGQRQRGKGGYRVAGTVPRACQDPTGCRSHSWRQGLATRAAWSCLATPDRELEHGLHQISLRPCSLQQLHQFHWNIFFYYLLA